ncbi:uncharacterized protein EI90DRAFT_3143551 [Cantharellus anzutake]|uniref:uncharacterized protein n=1 Tax=Cantharellus anzutake TaxID=1750568 RepID=UPI001908E26E|nr:uncharacterized protein EI90DRAFT_3143551 [Cantharellus anzutake]KAF8343159.1 hypothetical protein EI90DRAFT_3143551 [Cantharellus anzutake]
MRSTFFSALLALFLNISLTVFAAPANSTHPPACGSHVPADDLSSIELQFGELASAFEEIQKRDVEERGLEERAPKVINVYWHVINIGNTRAKGYLTTSVINSQLRRLNTDYAPSGFSFRLAGLYYVTSAQWFNLGDVTGSNAITMKRLRRRGGVRDLNIYSVGSASVGGTNLAGYSSFPWAYTANPKLDGVVIIVDALTGSTAYGGYYNLGRTLVHEVGHWTGLYHPFQGGCTGSGDYVSDTPAEASPAYYCPTGRDTCSGGGLDPIHNYMDYSSDVCRTQFTLGQRTRAKIAMYSYRGI